MDNRQFLDSLSRRISELLPKAAELGEEGRTAVRQILQKSLAELNVITQEEFDARDRALQRAQQRVDELEQQVRELERQVQSLQTD